MFYIIKQRVGIALSPPTTSIFWPKFLKKVFLHSPWQALKFQFMILIVHYIVVLEITETDRICVVDFAL